MVPATESQSTPGRPRSRWRLWFFRLVRLYLLYLLLLFLFQRSVIFPGQFRDAPEVSPTELHLSGGRALSISGGGKAWWFPGLSGKPLIAVYHGNGELIEDWWELATFWQKAGYGVLLTEYPGYGGVPGPPNRDGMLVQAREALVAVQEEMRGPTIALGVSLGSGLATALAAEGRVDGLVLAAPYTSLPAMARRRLAPGFLVRDAFDNVSALRQSRVPLLLVHGAEDKLIPPAMSLALRDAAQGAVQMVILQGVGHCGVLGGPFLESVERWLQETFPVVEAESPAQTGPKTGKRRSLSKAGMASQLCCLPSSSEGRYGEFWVTFHSTRLKEFRPVAKPPMAVLSLTNHG